jgi:hypothetical protein
VRALIARLLAAFLFLLSGGMIAWHVWTPSAFDPSMPAFLVVAFAGIFAAPLVTIVGIPIDPRTGRQPLWFPIATSALAVTGVGMGLLLAIALRNSAF